MFVSILQVWAENEANELMKKYDRNGDGVLTKKELQIFLRDVRGSTQLNNQGFLSRIPKTNDNVAHKLSSNAHSNPKMQVQEKATKSSTKVFSENVSDVRLSREQIKKIFKYYDSDKDGFLNITEVTKAFSFLGSINPFYKAQYAISFADANNDGVISEAELEKLIDYACKIIPKK
ncbi:probable calcium-binding protein CML14 [Cucurbita maxima]|uniref:Probable calcium-binding protein CML14 n=1 Tax=Cucurbita maxima TaxID=3661 RepID=A0A6J1KK82_CUCMA|nr:probable calcium-binding protein CML14 [Cucurbita maxima]